MKTIFIVLSRGSVVRNILRSKCFEILKNTQGLRIVLLINNILNTEPPKYLEEELGGENVILEFVPNKQKDRASRIYYTLSKFLVYTRSTWMVMQNKIEGVRQTFLSSVLIYIFRGAYVILSRLNFLKRLARWIGLNFFLDKNLDIYFDKYKPDLVFGTFILSNIDVESLKQAKKRKIKTVAMPKSWDNLDKMLFMVEPDIFLVQNKTMKEQAERLQNMRSEIKVVGFPQFDWYAHNNFLSKEEYCARKGFDSKLPILFLGSEGKWSDGDINVFRDIIFLRDNQAIPNCNILIRPHFGFGYSDLDRYTELRQYKNVFIDSFRLSDFFIDHWDPSKEDYEDFVNSLHYCNIMITFASTLTLDASCFDKPIILPDYSIKHGESHKTNLYYTGHYEQVIDMNAAVIAPTKEDVAKYINVYLANPALEREARAELRDRMCGQVDGKAGERIAGAILDFLNR